MGKYAGRGPKRDLSKIAKIDPVAIETIKIAIPPITQEQTDEITQDVIDQIDLSGKVDKEIGKALLATTEAEKIHSLGSDNQDLSSLQPKEIGKRLSTNDYTDGEKVKLAGIESGANNYSHPANHSPSIITQDADNRFITDSEKSTWNSKEPGNSNIQTHVTAAHAPSNAVSLAVVKADTDIADAITKKHSNTPDHTQGTDQGLDNGGANAVTAAQTKTAYTHSQAAHAPSDAQKNSNITKQEIEDKLIGEISSHTHPGGGGGLSQQQVEGLI